MSHDAYTSSTSKGHSYFESSWLVKHMMTSVEAQFNSQLCRIDKFLSFKGTMPSSGLEQAFACTKGRDIEGHLKKEQIRKSNFLYID